MSEDISIRECLPIDGVSGGVDGDHSVEWNRFRPVHPIRVVPNKTGSKKTYSSVFTPLLFKFQ